MPAIVLQPAQNAETEILVALLEDALPGETTRRAMLADISLTSYAACRNAELVGVVVVRWGDDSEIELLSVEATRRGQGIGRWSAPATSRWTASFSTRSAAFA